MSYPDGGFVFTSPLSSCHDPLLGLSSHCVRQAFGPTVQLIADALQRNSCSLPQLLLYLRRKCPPPPRRLGLPTPKQMTDPAAVRAALIMLIQHNIVTVELNASNILIYRYHPEKARNVMRYPRIVEWTKRFLDETAAAVMQTLLVAGRLRTADWVRNCSVAHNHRYTSRQQVVEVLYRLVSQGYVIEEEQQPWNQIEEEHEFEEQRPVKRVRLQLPTDDPDILSIINGNAHYQATLPIDAVWKVNTELYMECQRAFHLGRLVSERFSSQISSCGTFVSAMLRYRAHHPGRSHFAPSDIQKYISKQILQGQSLEKTFLDMSRSLRHPHVLHRVGADLYQVNVAALMEYLQQRTMHQIILDRHGEVAARIVRILSKHGWLDSDVLAEKAMVPARETRAILHLLFRSRYVELLPLAPNRQHNPANVIYLWGVNQAKLKQQITENVALALWNIRLRRQHEMEAGRSWMERAHAQDENEHEVDRLNKQKFCLALDRLDYAAIALDETLLVMNDLA